MATGGRQHDIRNMIEDRHEESSTPSWFVRENNQKARYEISPVFITRNSDEMATFLFHSQPYPITLIRRHSGGLIHSV